MEHDAALACFEALWSRWSRLRQVAHGIVAQHMAIMLVAQEASPENLAADAATLPSRLASESLCASVQFLHSHGCGQHILQGLTSVPEGQALPLANLLLVLILSLLDTCQFVGQVEPLLNAALARLAALSPEFPGELQRALQATAKSAEQLWSTPLAGPPPADATFASSEGRSSRKRQRDAPCSPGSSGGELMLWHACSQFRAYCASQRVSRKNVADMASIASLTASAAACMLQAPPATPAWPALAGLLLGTASDITSACRAFVPAALHWDTSEDASVKADFACRLPRAAAVELGVPELPGLPMRTSTAQLLECLAQGAESKAASPLHASALCAAVHAELATKQFALAQTLPGSVSAFGSVTMSNLATQALKYFPLCPAGWAQCVQAWSVATADAREAALATLCSPSHRASLSSFLRDPSLACFPEFAADVLHAASVELLGRLPVRSAVKRRKASEHSSAPDFASTLQQALSGQSSARHSGTALELELLAQAISGALERLPARHVVALACSATSAALVAAVQGHPSAFSKVCSHAKLLEAAMGTLPAAWPVCEYLALLGESAPAQLEPLALCRFAAAFLAQHRDEAAYSTLLASVVPLAYSEPTTTNLVVAVASLHAASSFASTSIPHAPAEKLPSPGKCAWLLLAHVEAAMRAGSDSAVMAGLVRQVQGATNAPDRHQRALADQVARCIKAAVVSGQQQSSAISVPVFSVVNSAGAETLTHSVWRALAGASEQFLSQVAGDAIQRLVHAPAVEAAGSIATAGAVAGGVLLQPEACESETVGAALQPVVPLLPAIARSSSDLPTLTHCLQLMALCASEPAVVSLTARDATAFLMVAGEVLQSEGGHSAVTAAIGVLHKVLKHHKRIASACLPCISIVLCHAVRRACQQEHGSCFAQGVQRCLFQLVRSAGPSAVRHHAPHIAAAFVSACSTKGSVAGAALRAENRETLQQGVFRLFDCMSAAEFQHLLVSTGSSSSSRVMVKSLRKSWKAAHKFRGQ